MLSTPSGQQGTQTTGDDPADVEGEQVALQDLTVGPLV